MSDTQQAEIVTCPVCGTGNRIRASTSGVPHCGSCGTPLPWLVESSEADFAAAAERSPIPVLVDFWAPWCGPCRIVSPAVEQASRQLAGRLKALKVNTDQAPSLSERFGIRGIPTLVLLNSGKEVDRLVGAVDSKSLQGWLENRLNGIR